METDSPKEVLGFIGGTGDEGKGLALRLASAGHRVLIGSRKPERARSAAEEVRSRAGETRQGVLEVLGTTNEEAVSGSDVVFVCVPYQGLEGVLELLRGFKKDAVLVSVVAPVERTNGGFVPVSCPSGSAAEKIAASVEVPVVSAFHHVPARLLFEGFKAGAGPEGWRPSCDVLVAGDDASAKERLFKIVEGMEGFRALDAGPLLVSRALEGLTAALINVNLRHRMHSFVRIETA
jgi:NADPH-dependent F420 reductase